MNNFASVLFVVWLSAQTTFAGDVGKRFSDMKMPPMTTEQRQKMADAHEKMAACLRSDKPVSDCHEEMMKACQEGMGKGGCPMMSGKGHGMHSGHMMHSSEPDSKPAQ